MGDLSAAMGIDLGFVGSGTNPYPGDIWHYARARLCMAARGAKIDAHMSNASMIGIKAPPKSGTPRSRVSAARAWTMTPGMTPQCGVA